MSPIAVMALSGGMDSTSLLLRLLAEGYTVTCISYRYGQKHSIEISKATENMAPINLFISKLDITFLLPLLI